MGFIVVDSSNLQWKTIGDFLNEHSRQSQEHSPAIEESLHFDTQPLLCAPVLMLNKGCYSNFPSIFGKLLPNLHKMRKIVTLLTLFVCLSVFAQKEVSKKVNGLIAQNVTFKQYAVLAAAAPNPDAEIKKVVESATFATLKTQAIANLVANKDQFIELEIPYLGNTIAVQLYKVDILAEGFHVDTDKAKSIAYEPGVYYRGIVKGDANSVAAFSFFKDEVSGLISGQPFNNLVIGQLDRAHKSSNYIIYSDADMKIQNDFECHTDDNVAESQPNSNKNNTLNPQSDKCVTMYFEMDHNLYTANGSNTTTTTNWMTSVFNNVKTLYANDGITVALKSIYIWVAPDSYTGETSSDYLNMFNQVRPNFDGDVGQLVGIDSGGLGGVAKTINGLCSQNNYSYSDVSFQYSSVPTYSWTVMVITHEFGHLLGSPHTHACVWNGNSTPIDSCGPYSIGSTGEGYSCMATPPLLPSNVVKGSIMSYCHLVNGIGIGLANGFGPQPLARVLATINGSVCLSTDCVNTCINTAYNIQANMSGSTATITWDQMSNTNTWLISVTQNGGLPNWIPVNGPPYIYEGLEPNTFYKIMLRPNCAEGGAVSFEDMVNIFVTTTDFCNNTVITDSGGVGGTYSNNENYVRTIIPSIANKKISLNFTYFFLIGQDRLFIYDGNSTAANDLTSGGLTGNIIPAPFESTAADGSLTIKFVSDGSLVRPGYVANVACTNILGTTNFTPNIDFTYSPNPTNGMVAISSKIKITEVAVYNSIGQLLYHQQINATDTKVDMTSFATGTYFFKLKFDDREANFKILKD